MTIMMMMNVETPTPNMLPGSAFCSPKPVLKQTLNWLRSTSGDGRHIGAILFVNFTGLASFSKAMS